MNAQTITALDVVLWHHLQIRFDQAILDEFVQSMQPTLSLLLSLL